MDLNIYLLKEGKTKTEFAKELGVSRKYLYSVISGRYPCGATLARLIEQLTNHAVTAQSLTGKRKPKKTRKKIVEEI
jgi:DNA-binding transcriptional regulator YdaS (Cro superfamily)